jgi:predicted unusual protein kinase regulating ubiquinone biosynthesis (AarF/ABC1/UbiB family)
VVRRTVERELDRPLDAVFRSFSTRPIAAASLAQVHEARLLDGTRVAVKVQYPEIEALVRSDLANLRLLFRAVGVVERDLDLMPLVDELGQQVPLELDFVNEGHNAEAAAELFRARGDVVVPAVHWEWTTRRVLVMEFVEGIKITDLDGLRRAGVDPSRVARLLVEAYCEQVLMAGFFHADPHPGNLFVQPDGPKLVLLDFGLTKSLPPHFREHLVELALALLRDDPAGVARAFLDLGFETRDGGTASLEEIARVFLEGAKELRTRPSTRADTVERLRRELPERIRANPIVRVPSHLVLLGRVLGLLSGVGRSLGAELDLVEILVPYVMRARTPGGV